MTPDNPYAVAFAFWHAALNENYDDLEEVITPESRGQWDLAEIRRRTEPGSTDPRFRSLFF
jgi:hypothetical protein